MVLCIHIKKKNHWLIKKVGFYEPLSIESIICKGHWENRKKPHLPLSVKIMYLEIGNSVNTEAIECFMNVETKVFERKNY